MNETIADRPVETEILAREELGGRFRRLAAFNIRHRDRSGQSVATRRELLEGGRVVGIIPYDAKHDRLVMIRQYRFAAHLATGRGEMIELPAGGVEPGESDAEAAMRELVEETGMTARAMTPAFSFMPTPGLTTEFATIFLALVDSMEMADAAGVDDDEDIIPFFAAPDEALAACESGAVLNGFAHAAILWFARHGRERARRLDEGEPA